jgi:hypothetical protein
MLYAIGGVVYGRAQTEFTGKKEPQWMYESEFEDLRALCSTYYLGSMATPNGLSHSQVHSNTSMSPLYSHQHDCISRKVGAGFANCIDHGVMDMLLRIQSLLRIPKIIESMQTMTAENIPSCNKVGSNPNCKFHRFPNGSSQQDGQASEDVGTGLQGCDETEAIRSSGVKKRLLLPVSSTG